MGCGSVYGIPKSCYGVRSVRTYPQPFKFTIIVNDMSEVMKHEDAELRRSNNYGIHSSSADWGYRISKTSSKKRTVAFW